MLMVVLDLFPAGVIQFKAIVEKGLWFARSDAFISGGVFESLTWLRGMPQRAVVACDAPTALAEVIRRVRESLPRRRGPD